MVVGEILQRDIAREVTQKKKKINIQKRRDHKKFTRRDHRDIDEDLTLNFQTCFCYLLINYQHNYIQEKKKKGGKREKKKLFLE